MVAGICIRVVIMKDDMIILEVVCSSGDKSNADVIVFSAGPRSTNKLQSYREIMLFKLGIVYLMNRVTRVMLVIVCFT